MKLILIIEILALGYIIYILIKKYWFNSEKVLKKKLEMDRRQLESQKSLAELQKERLEVLKQKAEIRKTEAQIKELEKQNESPIIKNIKKTLSGLEFGMSSQPEKKKKEKKSNYPTWRY